MPHPDFPDVDVASKGQNGPMRIGYFSDTSKTSADFVKACNEVGIPYNPDFNTPKGCLGVNKISELSFSVFQLPRLLSAP